MGRKGSWFSAVKKALTRNESKEKKEKRQLRTRSQLLSRESSTNSIIIHGSESNYPAAPALASEPASPTVSDILKLAHAQNEQNKQVYNSVALATAAAAEAAAAAAQAAAEIVRLTSVASFPNMARPSSAESIAAVEPLNEPEMAAVKIQKLYRGYRIRKELKTLKGILRLKGLVGSKSVKRQAMTTLKCMQTLAHVQSQVQARRIQMTEENLALQKGYPEPNEDKDWIMDSPGELEMVVPKMQSKHDETFEGNSLMGSPQCSKKLMQRKSHDQPCVVRVREREFNDQEWIGSPQSKEQMDAMMLSRQEAAIKRERALAYSYSRQQTWRNQSSKKEKPTIQDSQNPDWGWNWLDKWVTGLPCEPAQSVGEKEDNHSSVHSHNRRLSSSSVLHSKPPNGGSPTHRTLMNSSPKVARGRQTAPSPLRNATSENSRRTLSFSSSHTRNSSFSSTKSVPAKSAIVVQ